MKMDKRKVTVNYSFTIKVRFLLVISFITNSLVFWQNCVYVLADISQDKRLTTRIVTTKYGSLRGLHLNLPHNLQPIEMFLGIPYASPPTGKLRFMPPVTPAHWPGIRISDKHGPVCPQRLPDIRNETEALQKMTNHRLINLKRLIPLLQNQSEDCLYLNIYSPVKAAKSSSGYPVIMFIHGESYEWNAGSVYDGSILASFGNVIVVTINYRLGVLGFFPALDGTSRGNFGLMDQVAALHWVQENIAEFGGSPGNVTIFGHGYGASFVNLLMLSPMSKGLFQRAIMQSGSALSSFSMATESVRYSKLLGDRVGCPSDNVNKNSILLNCLRRKSLEEIMSVTFDSPKHLTIFGPTVDGIVIPNDPLTLMTDETSLFGQYDLLFGVTRVEYYDQFTDNDVKQGIEPVRREKILRTLVRNLYDYHLQEIYLTISNEYTDWTRPTSHPLTILDSLIDLLSDALVVAPLIKVATLHSRRNKRTYFYSFLYSTEDGDYPSRLGCVSGQDLNYIFGAPLISGLQLSYFSHSYTRSEAALSENLINNWIAFAKYGDPNVREEDIVMSRSNSNNNNNKESRSNRVERVLWPIYEEHQQQYYAITIKPKLRDHYHAHRMSYWLNLIPKLHVSGPSTATNQDHHSLHNHGDISSYDGIVRTTRFTGNSISRPLPGSSREGDLSLTSLISGGFHGLQSYANSSLLHNQETVHGSIGSTFGEVGDNYRQSALDSSLTSRPNSTVSLLGAHVNYSTALSVTIAIGCSLLILNVLVFAGVFYHRDRSRSKNSTNHNRANNNNLQSNRNDDDQKSEDNQDRWRLSKETGRSTLSYYPESNSFLCPSETLTTTAGDIQGTNSPSPLPVHQWMNQQQSVACSINGYQLNPYNTESIDILQGAHVSLNNCSYTATMAPSSLASEKNLTNLMDTSLVIEDQSKSKSMPSETGI